MGKGASKPRRLERTTAAELAPLQALFEPRYPDRLREMATVLYLALLDHGHTTDAPQLALQLTEALSTSLGGGSFYMHKGTAFRKAKEQADRDQQIRAEFRGYNLAMLAHKHGLTEVRIRQILGDTEEQLASRRARRERAAQFDLAQNGLFPGDATGA